MTHELMWTAPQPFWTSPQGAVVQRRQLAQPQILRFASDDFVQDLLSTLERDPATLTQFKALEETWRGPGSAPASDARRWLQREPVRFLGLRRKAAMQKRAQEGLAVRVQSGASAELLKLYQPSHLRHYLVSGSLVCQMPGLPDRQIDPARHKTSFVVRRLLPKLEIPAGQDLPNPNQTELWDEYAYEPRGKTGSWRKVAAANDEANAAVLLPGEERLAMSPATFTQEDGQRRRMFIGSVPVARREAYQGASARSENGESQGANKPLDPRLWHFHTQVLGPWKTLVNRAMLNGVIGGDLDDADNLKKARPEWVFDRSSDPNDEEQFDRDAPNRDALRVARSAAQTASWYLLLDIYLFLREYLNEFLDVVLAGQVPASGPSRELYDALNAAALPSVLTAGGALTAPGGTGSLVEVGGAYKAEHVEDNLIQALKRIGGSDAFSDMLEAANKSFEIPVLNVATPPGRPSDWPPFLFLFADPWFGVRQPPSPPDFRPRSGDYLAERIQARIDTLANLVERALPVLPAGKKVPEPGLASVQPVDMREAWYTMRLVYERPDCAPFHGNVVSAATQPFRMAGFFDSDAPARPVRIGLPVDISPAGLRKFDKNAVFVMSDMLCGQIDRMKGLSLGDLVLSVLPWPFHKDLKLPEKGPCQDGLMCSLSIPIVTICALLLLMIIVSLLDLFFRWMPYFMMCFPIKAKKV